MMQKINDREIPHYLNLKRGDRIAISASMTNFRVVGDIITLNSEVIHIYTGIPDNQYLIFPRGQIIIEVIEKFDTGKKIYPEVKKDE